MCDFAGTLKKAFSFWLSKAQNSRGLCNIQTERIKGVAGLKMALFALICTRFLLQVIRRAFWRFQAGRIKGAKVRRVSVQTQTAGATGTAGAKALQRRRGGGTQPKRQGQGSRQKNLGAKSTKTFWVSQKFWFSKNFQKKFRENEKGVCI